MGVLSKTSTRGVSKNKSRIGFGRRPSGRKSICLGATATSPHVANTTLDLPEPQHHPMVVAATLAAWSHGPPAPGIGPSGTVGVRPGRSRGPPRGYFCRPCRDADAPSSSHDDASPPCCFCSCEKAGRTGGQRSRSGSDPRAWPDPGTFPGGRSPSGTEAVPAIGPPRPCLSVRREDHLVLLQGRGDPRFDACM
jgi:hypothetical protein